MATGKPCRNTVYFGFSRSYLKNELGDPNLLLHKSDQQAKMKLSVKFKVAPYPLHRIFLNFAEVSFWHADYISEIKNGVTEFVFEI